MKRSYRLTLHLWLSFVLILCTCPHPLFADSFVNGQPAFNNSPDDVQDRLTRVEQAVEMLQQEMAGLKAQQGRNASGPSIEIMDNRIGELEKTVKQMGRSEAMDQSVAELQGQMAELADQVDAVREGKTKFLVAGTGKADFAQGNGDNGSFATTFSPHFYWKMSERSLFQSHVDIRLDNRDTDINLEFADYSYFLNPYMTLVAGKSLMPFGFFQERIHTAWINKLPDEPLALGDNGLAPTTDLGVQMKGVVPVGRTKFNYAMYVSNGPRLDTSDGADAGKLKFDNFRDNNRNKALGGRIGFVPLPGLEMGYSALGSRVGDSGTDFHRVDAFLQDVDLNYIKAIPMIKGVVDSHAEWVFSHVDRATYRAGSFDNKRSGGYVQLAYRPSMLKSNVLRNLEAVTRYDRLDQPSGGPVTDEQRWTWGLNYWLTSNIVIKAAYQIAKNHVSEDAKGKVMVQTAIGF